MKHNFQDPKMGLNHLSAGEVPVPQTPNWLYHRFPSISCQGYTTV